MTQRAPVERESRPDSGAGGMVELQAAFAALRAAEQREPYPEFALRREALEALASALRRRIPDMIAAADSDFGGRSQWTTKLGDVSTMLRELEYQRSNLRRWMAPQRRRVALHFKPARAFVHFQPLGVVGVIAPWNYPFRLAVGPTAAALAAGNRVLLKPSEYAPRSAALIADIIEDAGLAERVRVVLGDDGLAQALCSLPLDHLFFTGSTRVGKRVMRAASERLTPVTLELGGKCPAVIHPSAPLAYAARRIVAGKLFNAGQTCMAPDHVWVHRSSVARTLTSFEAEIRAQYPTLVSNPDYTAIINRAHVQRLQLLLADAAEQGAQVDVVNPAAEPFGGRSSKIPPALISRITSDMLVAREEIFGPLLPIREYDDIGEVLAAMRDGGSPLAAYYFDPDRQRCAEFLRSSRSGGVCINDVMLHSIQDDLPFGGVGASGMGRYHGKEGFETFSNQRAVFQQTRRNWSELLIPPYSTLARRVIDWLAG
ncbi:MAG TPA: aldehyde dehydrogenase family protein [Polyangiaceae bacterium]|nr:aldehyde dehydrogenase family protein [Polyangiaceae bacterium]